MFAVLLEWKSQIATVESEAVVTDCTNKEPLWYQCPGVEMSLPANDGEYIYLSGESFPVC